LEHLDQAGLVECGVGVGQADHAGHAAGSGSRQFGLQHALVLVPRLAQAGRQIDQARRHDEAGGVDAAVGGEIGRHLADGADAARGEGEVTDSVQAGSGVDQTAVRDQDFHASFPAMMPITAMRTAMPKVTCGRMTLCLPSATADSISTPRLIGPGCITMASDLARASLASVRPNSLKNSPESGSMPPLM
ncbi:hypothetical protein OY671_009886, partial [Metschnikowia pulcherrima]